MRETISCMNIQPVPDITRCLLHNSRAICPSYLVDSPDKNSCDLNAEEAEALYVSLMDEAIFSYIKRTGQTIQVDPKKIVWEAVFIANSKHTMKDATKLSDYFKKNHGWQTMQKAVHADEGYVDDVTGEIVYNYHIHIVFLMLSKDGIFMFKKRDYGKKRMASMQTDVAKILGMPRGTSKQITGNVHYSPKQYRKIAKERDDKNSEIARLSGEVATYEDVWLKEVEANKSKEKEFTRLKNEIKVRDNKIRNLEYSIEDSNSENAFLEIFIKKYKDALLYQESEVKRLKLELKKAQDEILEFKKGMGDNGMGPGMGM